MEERKILHDLRDPEGELRLIDEAAEYLKGRGFEAPEVAVILGTGLGTYADKLENRITVPYSEIPGFLVSTAPGHKGMLCYGQRMGRNVLLMAGRLHCYEGYSMYATVFPVRVMARLGIKRILITNAAGAIDPFSIPGDLMLIRDHINLSGNNPLIGANIEALGPRFPDMTYLYPAKLRRQIREKAWDAGIRLTEGVYAMMLGPSFETPAEIRFLRTIGADAVGMSTVPEAITAGHAGMEVVAISCLSNAAAGVLDEPIDSDHVEKVAGKVAADFATVVDIVLSLDLD
ncbi:MAG: purine-nucleoside phosphorylase [Mogibacterium sp.]|nr:purine-nucleoside phosphorylase [Mogibacterium sp.]